MTQIQAVIFDIGGVLKILSGPSRYRAWLMKESIDPAPVRAELEAINRHAILGSITEAEMNAKVKDLLNLSDFEFREASEAVWSDSLGVPNQELADYFTSLRPRWKTGLLSNGFVGARQREDEKYNFSACADVILYSYEVGMLKPDARIYALMCRQLGIEPDAAVFLDDLPDNVAGARAAGLHAVLFIDNRQAISELEDYLRP